MMKDEVGGVLGVDRYSARGKTCDVVRHVGPLHEAVAQHHPVDAVAEIGDLAARRRGHEGVVRHLDGEQYDILVQHLVMPEVLRQAARGAGREGGEVYGGALRPQETPRRDRPEQLIDRQNSLLLALHDGEGNGCLYPHKACRGSRA